MHTQPQPHNSGTGVRAQVSLRRRTIRVPIGADCLDCGWQEWDDAREHAKQHAMENPGHKVHCTVEETTVYVGTTQ